MIQVFSLVLAVGVPGISIFGCAPQSQSARADLDVFAGPATTESIAGDWEDVDVAVSAAAIRMEMTVLHGLGRAGQGDDESADREYQLRSVTDEPVWVLVRRTDGPWYEVSAKIGRFGHPEREQELIGWISRRLRELAGVDVRRIKWMRD